MEKKNLELVEELSSSVLFADEQGYWKGRGYEEFPGWENLPFADFFENLSKQVGHKKMWLNPDGKFKAGRLSYSNESLMPLYNGIKETQRRIVSAGFFIYSALIVNLHMRLAYYSRLLKVRPSMKAIFEVANEEQKLDLTYRALALRVAAYLVYEGDGLGGYSDKVWLLWGRIFNIPCPDNPELLDKDELADDAQAWFFASDEERRGLFLQWWAEIDEAHAKVNPNIVNQIYTGYKLYTRYQLMESPVCPLEFQFNPESTFDVQAALCGFFRRSAGGLTEAKAMDISDIHMQPHRFVDMLIKAKPKVIGLLKGHVGITPFGKYILSMVDLTDRRVEMIMEVLKRQELDQLTYNNLVKEGKVTKVAKRGSLRK